MHAAPHLIAVLRARGNRLDVTGDGRLAVSGGATLTDDLRAAIRTHRDAILDCLADHAELWEERAAIREYDGGFPRAMAERLAARDVEHPWNDAGPITQDWLVALCDAAPVSDEVVALTAAEELTTVETYARDHVEVGDD